MSRGQTVYEGHNIAVVASGDSGVYVFRDKKKDRWAFHLFFNGELTVKDMEQIVTQIASNLSLDKE